GCQSPRLAWQVSSSCAALSLHRRDKGVSADASSSRQGPARLLSGADCVRRRVPEADGAGNPPTSWRAIVVNRMQDLLSVYSSGDSSSENQRESSIEDQVRSCKLRIEIEGWSLTTTYSDYALSLADARARR